MTLSSSDLIEDDKTVVTGKWNDCCLNNENSHYIKKGKAFFDPLKRPLMA